MCAILLLLLLHIITFDKVLRQNRITQTIDKPAHSLELSGLWVDFFMLQTAQPLNTKYG